LAAEQFNKKTGKTMFFNRPFRLDENRVWRIYQGGALIDRFRHKKPETDAFFPEDWIGSTTRAVNAGRENLVREGLSTIRLNSDAGKEQPLLSEILKDPQIAQDIFGPAHVARFGTGCGVLVKLLDSKIRLPLQTHPDKTFAKKNLNSNFGKSECWIILGGREINGEKPHVFFGFKEGVKKAEFERCFTTQDIPGMISLLNKVYVEPGQVFTIPANLIHAIGAGVFLMEIQEPSDHVFHFDRKGECWNLSEYQVHMNLGQRMMLDTIDYSVTGSQVFSRFCSRFNPTDNNQGTQEFLPHWITDYFRGNFITAVDLVCPILSVVIGIVVGGTGVIQSDDFELPIGAGDTFMIPFCVKKIRYKSKNPLQPLQILQAMPPRS
jgi:mannose-6-phosphate isomerase